MQLLAIIMSISVFPVWDWDVERQLALKRKGWKFRRGNKEDFWISHNAKNVLRPDNINPFEALEASIHLTR